MQKSLNIIFLILIAVWLFGTYKFSNKTNLTPNTTVELATSSSPIIIEVKEESTTTVATTTSQAWAGSVAGHQACARTGNRSSRRTPQATAHSRVAVGGATARMARSITNTSAMMTPTSRWVTWRTTGTIRITGSAGTENWTATPTTATQYARISYLNRAPDVIWCPIFY